MLNYRPQNADEEEDWEDNVVSNSMAYASDKLVPKWCKSPDHWTVRLVLYLWADCACCLAFRFFAFGVILGLAVSAAFVILMKVV